MAFRSLRPRNGLWIYFGEGVPIDATNHRGVSGSVCCHGYEQFNLIVTFNPVVMRSSLAKLAENSPCSNRQPSNGADGSSFESQAHRH